MSDEKDDDTKPEVADEDYRGRGRPRLPDGMRRDEKLTIALTVAELRELSLAAANCTPVPLRVNDWVRNVVLNEARKK